ncbi:Polyadenylate-binding protein-interacting protein 3 [Dionaea muscipula]
MNLQQAVQPRPLANGFSHRRLEKGASSRINNELQFGKLNLNRVAGVTSSNKTEHESASRDRLVYLTTCLIGHQVDVQVKNGSVFSGIFHATNADKDFGIVLKMARLTKDASSQGCMAGSDSVGKVPSKSLIIPAHELVQVSAKDLAVTCNGVSNELERDKLPEIMLDSYISNTRHVEVERELARWVPEGDDPQCPELENIFDSSWTGSWDQFKVNETLFGVKSTFNEEIYTTKLEKGPQMRELEEEALRIAREIEGEETHDLHLAEERGLYSLGHFDIDEEARYSSVLRTSDDSDFDEENVMWDASNGETFRNSPACAISRSFAEATSGKSHEGGQALPSFFPVDEVQTSQLNISSQVYQSDSLASEDISWGIHDMEQDFRVQENHKSEAEQDGLTNEFNKMQTFSEKAETTKTEDLPSLLDIKKDGFDRGGLSPDATEYPSEVSQKCGEKTSSLGEFSDDAVSSKVQGPSQPKASPGNTGSSISSISGPRVSPSSSVGSFSSEKSSLNPNAKEFKLNPNAKSFVPTQTPLRPLSPVSGGSFYFPAGMPSHPHVGGMPIGIGVGPSFVSPQPMIFNPQVASIQSPQAYFPANGPQFGQPMIIGHPRQVMYMPGYPTEIPYKGREY